MSGALTQIHNLGDPDVVADSRVAKFLRYCSTLILLGTGFSHFTHVDHYDVLYGVSSWTSQLIGSLFILTGGLLIFPISKKLAWLDFTLPLATFLLIHLSIASFVRDSFAPEQLIEQGIKIGTPWLYWRFASGKIAVKRLFFWLKVCILMCFVGHGMFAVGLHFVPDSFLKMTTTILGIDNIQAKNVLFVIGILDFIAAAAIFVSNNIVFYSYLIVWGLLTSLARIVCGGLIFDGDIVELLHYFFNTIFRLPHGLIPLLVFSCYRGTQKK